MKVKEEQRLGRKPQSGEELMLSARRVVGIHSCKGCQILEEKPLIGKPSSFNKEQQAGQGRPSPPGFLGERP